MSAMLLLNTGAAFAGIEPKELPETASVDESLPSRMLYEGIAIPALYGEDANLSVLISNKPEYNWSSEGKSGKLENSPICEKGSMYFPLREIAENIGFTVEWNESDRSVDICKEEFTAKMYIDNKNFETGGDLKNFDAGPLVIDGKTFLSESGMEKLLGIFITDQNGDLFLNNCDVEIVKNPVAGIEDWISENRETVGRHIKRMDGFSYVLIVEEEKTTGGYTFDFSNLEVEGGILRIEYDLNPPNEPAIQVLTKPFSLLKISNEIYQVKVDRFGYTGTISDLKFGEHGATLYLEGENPYERFDDLVVMAGIDTEIEDGTSMDFKIGTVLDVQYSFSTRSIPAQTTAEKIRVISAPDIFSTYKGSVKETVEDENTFSVRLAKDSNFANDLIVHIKKGSFMASEMQELDGKTMTVEYTIMTMSIPAQTSPIKICVER